MPELIMLIIVSESCRGGGGGGDITGGGGGCSIYIDNILCKSSALLRYSITGSGNIGIGPKE